MAAKDPVESLTEEAVCPICLDFFTDPVILECGHNFCRSCITQSWDREERNSCPECREVFTDRTLRVSRALARLAEKARTLSLNREIIPEKESKLHCEKHQEELKLFCETDKKLICLVYRDAREHKSHSFMPVDEAVEIFKVRKLFPAQTDLAKRLLLIFLSVVILQVYFATEEEPGLSSTVMDSPSDLPWYGAALIPTASDRAETHCILHLVAGRLWKPPNSQRSPTRDSSSQVHKL